MTDELSPEFLAFSELLDQEESLPSASLDENARLLLALRNELREGSAQAPELPSHFAASTAAKVVRRWQAQSSVDVALVRLEPWLRARLASWRGVAGGTGLLALLGFAFYEFSLVQLALSGVLLGVLALSLKGLYSWRLPGTFELSSRRSLPELSIPGIYYLLPAAAVWFTAMLAGWGVASLEQVSLSFRASSGILPLAGFATSGVTFFWLLNAGIPFWKAAQQRPFLAQAMIWLSSLWLACLAQFYFRLHEIDVSWDFRRLGAPEYSILALLPLTALISLVVASRKPTQDKIPWRKALKRSFTALLVGIIPVVMALFLILRFGLTRELRDEAAYATMVREAESYVAAQRAIKPQDNGMTELRPYFFRSQLDYSSVTDRDEIRRAQEVADRLRKGNLLWRGNKEATSPEDRAKARADFLRELPRIEKAVSKPYFSSLFDQQLGLSTEIPNYILCRAVAQALAGLEDEALTAGHTEQALGYLETNLKWSRTPNSDSLIGLMISVAMESIALTDTERLVFEGDPSPAQLERLQIALEQATPTREDLKKTMLRETYAVDRTLQGLVSGKLSRAEWVNYAGRDQWVWLYRLLPSSYWESERLAYLNHQLDQITSWQDLGAPMVDDITEVLAMNPIASEITPNSSRAQLQVTRLLSRYNALQTVVALERYHREHGAYPEQLVALVPNYLEKLPVDAVSPNRWDFKPNFGYRKFGSKYELVSTSPLYSRLGLSERQVYGPDGDYEETKGPQDRH